ncbi:MAG: DUF3108 domain-containing protein [Methylophilaceae bacterium]
MRLSKISVYWRYVFALAVSVLLHLLIVFGSTGWHWPLLDEDDEHVVEVQLSLPPPQAPPKRVAVKKAIPVHKAPVAPVDQPVADSGSLQEQPSADERVFNEAVLQDAPQESDPLEIEFHAGHIDMDFDVLRGDAQSKIGVARIRYKANEDRTYKLSSETEAKGIASLILSGKLVQMSEGVVSPTKGLQPSSFFYQYGSDTSKAQHAEFNWQEHTLTLNSNKGVSKVALPEDAQDLLSFMYQFMFIPPLVNMQLSVTNGKRLHAYTYLFEGQETLSTKLGDVQVVHIVRSNGDGDEKTELWLAVDYKYLPFKIRKTEKDGNVMEQIVTRLDTDIFK